MIEEVKQALMDCYVINLDRSPDRLNQMKKEFDRLQMKFIRVAAVDGNELSETEFQSHAEFRNLSRPQVGVLLSHQKCWDLFAHSHADYCAIFEDDVHLGHDLKDVLDAIEHEKIKFDVLKIETARKKVLISKEALFSVRSRKIQRIGSYHVGAAGYIIHRNFLIKISEFKLNANTIPVDEFLFEFLINHSDILQLNPAIVIQDQAEGVTGRTNTKSLIATDRRIRKISLVSKILREIKRPINQLLRFQFGAKLYNYKKIKIDFT